MWVERELRSNIRGLSSRRPCLLLTGARQVGKSSLLRALLSKAEYVTLGRVGVAGFAEINPMQFLKSFSGQVILDEIQDAPSIFRELKIAIDENHGLNGKWILTGSQKFSRMRRVTESLAGRLSLVGLETLSLDESRPYKEHFDPSEILWKGGYPELWANKGIDFKNFFETYVQTYLERDLQALIKVNSLRDFQRFLKAAAIRVGQLINFSDIAKDVGVSQVTIKSWISALETSGLITLLGPYYKNMGKRLIKAPKLYFNDNGLLCHLLGIENGVELESHIYKSSIWENLVFAELIKTCDLIPNRNLFFYRDQNGVEIDFLVERKAKVTLIEVKDSEKFDPKKLNFKKVAPLFQESVKCILANRCEGGTVYKLKEWYMINPIFCDDWPIA